MEIEKINFVFDHKLFSDLRLILDDSVDKIILDVHRFVLYTKCSYFEKLLSNCREKNMNEICMKVTNAQIMRDIIMSFYGKTSNHTQNCRYHLERIKCLDFLGLQIDLAYFENNSVSNEDFDLLLDVLDIIGYNAETINILTKNIPENYDLSLLPRELLQEILDSETSLKIAATQLNPNKISLWSCDTKIQNKLCEIDLTIELFRRNNDSYHLEFLADNQNLAFVYSDGKINLYDIDKNSVSTKYLSDIEYKCSNSLDGLSLLFYRHIRISWIFDPDNS